MFNLKTSLNSLGILLTLVGVFIVYKNSPINFHGIDGGRADTDFSKIERDTKRMNDWMVRGVYIVLFGTLLQLASNYVPA